YSASITWGDGSSSAGSVVDNHDGTFSVQGSHTYAEEASGLTFSVQIQDSGGANVSGSAALTVADAALTLLTLTPPSAVEGQALTSTTVATFRDADGAGAVGDYSASITWGDGSTSTGSVVDNHDGTFSVQGSHTYAEE